MSDDQARRIAAAQDWARRNLDRTPFGEALARAVWHRLQGCAVDEGLIHAFHRDYCGHGLLRTATGVKLCRIDDGIFGGPPIAAWSDEASFVAFFARQSDWSCSGMEPAEPVFFTSDEWERCNQRLMRRHLEEFLGG
jgi:hypothetical protein